MNEHNAFVTNVAQNIFWAITESAVKVIDDILCLDLR